MSQLPIKIRFCQNKMSARFLRALSKDEPIILMIPGGPCLSNKYLDLFLKELGNCLKVNVGNVDLPNHGDSTLISTWLPLSYQACLEFIYKMLKEISHQCDKIILFGQSFGARLVYDLAYFTDINISGIFLTGFPCQFKISEELAKKIDLLDQGSFINLWPKILQLYTFNPLPDESFSLLTSDLCLIGNEAVLNDVPQMKKSLKQLPISILQGDHDYVVPDNNLTILKKLIPQANFYDVKDCGHFPMIEKPTETLNAFTAFYSSLK